MSAATLRRSRARPATLSARDVLKIHLYILKQLLVAFVFAVAGLLFIALPGIAVSTVHKLPNVDVGILIGFLPIVLQGLAPYVLPLCFMLSTVAVFGRLAADKEWIAIHMAGIHPLSTLLMPGFMALVLGCVTFWMVSNELPQLKQKQKRFLVDATASVMENLQPGRTSIQVADFFLKAEYRDARTGTFYNVYFRYLRDSEAEARHVDVFAGTVDIWIEEDFLHLRAFDVEVMVPETGETYQQGEFLADIDIAARIDQQQQTYDRAKYLVSSELRRQLKAGGLDERKAHEYRFMLHYRATMFAIFFLFLLLGAATGLLMRRGTQLGALAVAAGYGILYYVFNMRLGKELGELPSLPPWVGAWLTTAVGSVVAVFLIRRAIRR